MKRYYPSASLGKICWLFGVTRQAYYKQICSEEKKIMEEAIILKLVEDVRIKLPCTGTRKLLNMIESSLKQHQIKIGRDNLFDLLGTHGLLIRRRRRRYPKTTDPNHRFRRYSNLVKELIIYRPEQVRVSDITYLSLPTGFCYLNLITDAYSHKIMGYCLHRTLAAEGTLNALRMALSNRQRPSDTLIHHSDRGIQYCCTEYVNLLTSACLGISMAKNENPIAERVNGILKTELGLEETFLNFEQAQIIVTERIRTYNELRIHASCDYFTPEQAHQKEGILNKRWKTYRKNMKKIIPNI